MYMCVRLREPGVCGSCAPRARSSLCCCLTLTLELIRRVAPQLGSAALHNDKGPAWHQAVILGDADIRLIHNITTCGQEAEYSAGERQLGAQKCSKKTTKIEIRTIWLKLWAKLNIPNR